MRFKKVSKYYTILYGSLKNEGRLHKNMKAEYKNLYSRQFKGIWIPKEIYLEDGLNPVQKILLAEIDSLDNGEGCFASNEYLANFLEIETGSLANVLTDLRKKGWIIDRKFDGRKRYMSINQRITIDKPRRDLEIISLFIKETGLQPDNKEQFNQIVKRNLKIAQTLIGYSDEDIRKTILVLKNTDYLKKFTLETVGKYIDSVVAEKTKQGPKIIKFEEINIAGLSSKEQLNLLKKAGRLAVPIIESQGKFYFSSKELEEL